MKLSVFAMLFLLAACDSKKEEPAGPRKLSKMDVRVSVDAKGRIRPMFQLFDQKLKPVTIGGTYSIAIARADGTELCKLAGEFAPADFTDNQAYRAAYRDANCPADPEASDLKIDVKVESPDKTIERTLNVAARMVYENLKPPVPTGSAGSGSATGSAGSGATGSAGSGSDGSGSAGSNAAGSAGSAKPPAEAPPKAGKT